ncbi:hypothetical protein EYF80_028222 [Liparis tanakae]|uniref:Uncharacterized protein n=1 Tax=Liparis tanakae TaxID=230148 RepID=A0A4Z2H7X2_9TELE|nr:hypothetical protein EYF80_028222 [Liparis tanakae]
MGDAVRDPPSAVGRSTHGSSGKHKDEKQEGTALELTTGHPVCSVCCKHSYRVPLFFPPRVPVTFFDRPVTVSPPPTHTAETATQRRGAASRSGTVKTNSARVHKSRSANIETIRRSHGPSPGNQRGGTLSWNGFHGSDARAGCKPTAPRILCCDTESLGRWYGSPHVSQRAVV